MSANVSLQNVEVITPASLAERRLISGRLLARNTIWNLLGNGAPMAVAVFCIPVLIRGLGKDRFGVLTLAWALIGYASLFDLGLGRALTQLVAQKLGEGREEEIPSLAWTSLILMLLLGLVGSLTVILIAPVVVEHGLKVSLALQSETVQAFRILAISIPFVITNAGLRGLLEAHQQFRLISALRFPAGVFTFAGPLLVLPYSHSVVPVVGTLVVGRIVLWAAYLLLCVRVLPQFGRAVVWERASIRPLLSFGGWMTVTNVVSPLLVTLDRFLVGALVSMTAVAYYASPYEVVTKLLLVPGALMGVMFPAFSTGYVQDPKRTAALYARSIKVLVLVLFPIMLCSVALASDGLKLWLGADFAQHSFRVFQFLAVGVFINSLAQVPFTLIQGVGRPDITAKLHLIELPLYLGTLCWMIRMRGIEGAALAWTLRVAFDAVFLFALSRRFLFGAGLVRMRTFLLPGLAMMTFAAAALLNGYIIKTLFLAIFLLGFAIIMWFRILTPDERKLAQSYR